MLRLQPPATFAESTCHDLDLVGRGRPAGSSHSGNRSWRHRLCKMFASTLHSNKAHFYRADLTWGLGWGEGRGQGGLLPLSEIPVVTGHGWTCWVENPKETSEGESPRQGGPPKARQPSSDSHRGLQASPSAHTLRSCPLKSNLQFPVLMWLEAELAGRANSSTFVQTCRRTPAGELPSSGMLAQLAKTLGAALSPSLHYPHPLPPSPFFSLQIPTLKVGQRARHLVPG